jgi:hypothetical protein
MIRRIICRVLCGEPPPPPPPAPKDKPIAFEPGKVIILAEYPPELELTPREIVARVAARLARLQLDPRLEVNLAPERVSVLRGAERTLATVTGDVPAARQSPRQLLRFVSQLHRAIALPPLTPPELTPPIEREPPSNDQSPDQSAPVDQNQPPAGDSPAQQSGGAAARAARPATPPAAAPARGPRADAEGFDLRAASPNWLSSGAKYIGGGGPGGWPSGIASVTPNPSDPQPWDFGAVPQLTPPVLGALDVEVAILDTAPSITQLTSAYDTWVGNGPAQPPLRDLNPLLMKLLAGPNGGPFSVVEQTQTPGNVSSASQLDVIYQPGIIPLSLQEHPYTMASHGLFVAGIIRSLAPQAKLRLIQVLNDDAGGSVESIANGLALVDRPGRSVPLVVNCSFTLRIPRLGDPPPPEPLGLSQEEIDELSQLMHDLFIQLSLAPNTVIVGAAGNDSGGGTRLLARYPAAYQGIAGVSALAPVDNHLSTLDPLTIYSNQADDPPDEGFAAFGGTVIGNPPFTADPNNGILGVFLEDLPADIPNVGVVLTPNASGWVRWAGTSFSAPIVSAVLANLISSSFSPLAALVELAQIAPDFPANGVINDVPVWQPPAPPLP